MSLQFSSSLYFLWLPLFIATSLAYAFLFYRKDKQLEGMNKPLIFFLAGLRAFGLFMILFLLLEPVIETLKKEVEKPLLLIFHDDSESIRSTKDSTFYQTEYLEDWQNFVSRLSDEYSLHHYTLGEGLEPGKEISFNAPYTRLSGIGEKLEQDYFQRNVGAILLASDGIYNKGSHPMYDLQQLRVPVYTLALGDTSIYPDLRINRVTYNKIAFKGNTFPLLFEISGKKVPAGEYELLIRKKSEIVQQDYISISESEFVLEYEIELVAEEEGIHRYTAEIRGFSEEENLINNEFELMIEVLDRKQKILFIALTPHPDVSAIRQALEIQQHYELDFFLKDDFNGNPADYNLLILHQLPSASYSPTALIRTCTNSQIPIWFILGNQSDIKKINQWQNALKIFPLSDAKEEAQPFFAPGFSAFELNSENISLYQSFPPLWVPLANYQLEPGNQVLFNQRIGRIASDKVLFSFFVENDQKIALTLGEGLWRWRLHNFRQVENHDAFDELIQKTVQYLALKLTKERLLISANNVYMQGEPIIFQAELYNPSFEKLLGPSISLQISNSEGLEYDYNFGLRNYQYLLNVGSFPVGDYDYRAEVELDNERFISEGKFSVASVNLEGLITEANHKMLKQLALDNRGAMFYPNQFDNLYEAIKQDQRIVSVARSEKSKLDLISLQWLLIAFISLFTFEWFIRKYYGAY